MAYVLVQRKRSNKGSHETSNFSTNLPTIEKLATEHAVRYLLP